MKLSFFTILKDTAILFIFFITAILIIEYILPDLVVKQNIIYKNYYQEVQNEIIKQTAEVVRNDILCLNVSLEDLNIDKNIINGILLRQLQRALGDSDYLTSTCIIDYKKNVIYSPLPANFPDGTMESDIIMKRIKDSDAGFFEYLCENSKTGNVDCKTSYALKLPEFSWIIISGYYNSDLEQKFSYYSVITNRLFNKYKKNLIVIILIIGIISFVIIYIFNKKIKYIENYYIIQILNLRQYKEILDESSMVSRTDVNGIITYVNDKYCETTGFKRETVIGKKHNIERHPDTPLETFKSLWTTIVAGSVWRGIIKNRKADGSSYIKKTVIAPLKNENNKITEFLSSCQDITEIVEKRRELENAFNTDSLTGLGNRIKLLKDIEKTDNASVILIDIKNFALINQAFGNCNGDKVLKKVGIILLQQATKTGMNVYRVYADTYAILGSCVIETDFADFADSFVDCMSNMMIQIDEGASPIPIIVNVGASCSGSNSFAYADIALKKAKKFRKQIFIYSPDSNNIINDECDNLDIFRRINYALKNDRIYPAFQPIIDLKTGKVTKYECLMRLRDENENLIMPNEFLEISKKTNLYPKMTLRMIEKSINYFKDKEYDFSINLTLEDIMNRDTISYLISEAQNKNVLNRLIIEIVESEELEDYEKITRVLSTLSSTGLRIAIDDFGSGYSNFDYLLKLNPAFIKIDRTITQNILQDVRAKELLKSIVNFAKYSKIKTIAEYIDSEQLQHEVNLLDVDYAQGWLIGRPVDRIEN